MKSRKTLAIIIAVSLILMGYLSIAQTAVELLPKAIQLEEVKGELEQAIEVYQTIVKNFPENKPIAAKAYLHIGLCYEKLGNKEAQQAYQRVMDDYPEQSDEVSVARNRLANLERALTDLNHKPTFRKIKIASNPQNGVLSPDGNELAFFSDGALWTVPLHGKVNTDIAGEPTRVAEVQGGWDSGSLLAWSADGEWIAVNIMPDDEPAAYIIPKNAGEPRIVALPDRGGHSFSYRLSLSPNGQMLAFSAIELGTHLEMPDPNKRYIYTIPTTGGEPNKISSEWARLPSYSTDGAFIAYVGYRLRDDWQEKSEGSPMTGDLWIASSDGDNPSKLADVDGRLRGPVWSPNGQYIAAHYEPSGTNDSKEIWVYPLTPDVTGAGTPEKIVLPKSSWNMLAGWTPDNELGVFIQSEQHQAIYTVPASGGKAVQITPEGDWPYYPRWSPDGTRIYFRSVEKMVDKEKYKIKTKYVSAAGGDPVEIPLQSERWLVSIVPGGGHNISPDGKKIVISAFQEPYDTDEGGDIWTIPVEGGSPTRLTNDKSYEGFPCWSPDGKWIAFGDEQTDTNDFPAIYIKPAEGGEMRQITSEADSLEEGAITFSRDGKHIAFFSAGAIKTIPVEGGQSEVLVADIKPRRYAMHSQLAYSPDGSKIAYNANGKIWITRLDGGAPAALNTGLVENAKLGEFGWSPDGEKIVFMVNIGGEAEFWLISDFLPIN